MKQEVDMRRCPHGRWWLPGVLGLALAAAPVTAQTDALPLQAGITGSTPAAPELNPTAMLARADVQALILRLAAGPLAAAEVTRALESTPFSPDDLVRVGLLREEQGFYRIDFTLLTVEDQLQILRAAEPLARSLADAVLARAETLRALAEARPHPGVSTRYVLYILGGCFSLDWDGLDLTRERGYREGPQRVIEGNAFTPWAKVRGADISLRGLYWGSHNEAATAFTFTTFGDHDALPRRGLPDAAWRGEAPFADDVSGLDRIAAVLAGLRDGPTTVADLARATDMAAADLDGLLDDLAALGYVERTGNRVRARVLVLTREDRPMVEGVRHELRRIAGAWHERHYDDIRARLAGLTPVRQGV
ncbi:MAG: hypothetical protein D6701_01155, partial [Gemmatimonadetes bacterium]